MDAYETAASDAGIRWVMSGASGPAWSACRRRSQAKQERLTAISAARDLGVVQRERLVDEPRRSGPRGLAIDRRVRRGERVCGDRRGVDLEPLDRRSSAPDGVSVVFGRDLVFFGRLLFRAPAGMQELLEHVDRHGEHHRRRAIR